MRVPVHLLALPGLFAFHLTALLVMVLIGTSAQNLVLRNVCDAVLTGQLMLTVVWASLGAEPAVLRIPSAGILALLGAAVFTLILSDGHNVLFFIPLLLWVTCVIVLLLIRLIPGFRRSVILLKTLQEHSQVHGTRSLVLSLLILTSSVAVLSAVLHRVVIIRHLPPLSPDAVSNLLIGMAVMFVTILLGLMVSLTVFADWLFYRRRWSLAVLMVVYALLIFVMWNDTVIIPNRVDFHDYMRKVLTSAGVYLGTLLILGLTGYRLVGLRQATGSPELATSVNNPKHLIERPGLRTMIDQPDNDDGSIAAWLFIGKIIRSLSAVHIGSLVGSLCLYAVLLIGDRTEDHKLRSVTFSAPSDASGNILSMDFKDGVLDTDLKNLNQLPNLRKITFTWLGAEQITNNGLRHLRDLAHLETLSLTSVSQVTDEGLKHLKGLSGLKNLWLPPRATDAGLLHLRGLTQLEILNGRGTSVSGSGLRYLQGCTGLRVLNLEETKVTDESMEYLGTLHGLETLHLSGTPITDDGLKYLDRHRSLKRLTLGSHGITDCGLKYLRSLLKLERLSLRNTAVTDQGLVHLGGMTLRELYIPAAAKTDRGLKHYLAAVQSPSGLMLHTWQLTDAGMEHLKEQKDLRTLSLPGSITDKGLVALYNLTDLQSLRLSNTQVTQSGRQLLKMKLPGCQIW